MKVNLRDLVLASYGLLTIDDEIEDSINLDNLCGITSQKLINKCTEGQIKWIQDTFNINVTLESAGDYNGGTLVPTYAQYKINDKIYMDIFPVQEFVYEALTEYCDYILNDIDKSIIIDTTDDINNIAELAATNIFNNCKPEDYAYCNNDGIGFTFATKEDIKLLDANLLKKVIEVLDGGYSDSEINFKDGSESMWLTDLL